MADGHAIEVDETERRLHEPGRERTLVGRFEVELDDLVERQRGAGPRVLIPVEYPAGEVAGLGEGRPHPPRRDVQDRERRLGRGLQLVEVPECRTAGAHMPRCDGPQLPAGGCVHLAVFGRQSGLWLLQELPRHEIASIRVLVIDLGVAVVFEMPFHRAELARDHALGGADPRVRTPVPGGGTHELLGRLRDARQHRLGLHRSGTGADERFGDGRLDAGRDGDTHGLVSGWRHSKNADRP